MRASAQAGSSFLVFLLVLGLLLGIVTAYAIKYNPLYSDRETYGISKYAFIEQCKEKLLETDELDLSIQGQIMKLGKVLENSKQLRAGEHAGVYISGPSKDLVAGVQPLDAGKLGLIAPVKIVAERAQEQRVLAPATMQCLHEKGQGVTVQLGIGQ